MTMMGSLLKTGGCQMVLMAHGDTSYDDLGFPEKLTVTVAHSRRVDFHSMRDKTTGKEGFFPPAGVHLIGAL